MEVTYCNLVWINLCWIYCIHVFITCILVCFRICILDLYACNSELFQTIREDWFKNPFYRSCSVLALCIFCSLCCTAVCTFQLCLCILSCMLRIICLHCWVWNLCILWILLCLIRLKLKVCCCILHQTFLNISF